MVHRWILTIIITSKLPRRGEDDIRSGGERRNLSGNRWRNRGSFKTPLDWPLLAGVWWWNKREAAELSDRWKRNLSSDVGTFFPTWGKTDGADVSSVTSLPFDVLVWLISLYLAKQSLRERLLLPRSVVGWMGSTDVGSSLLPRSKSWPQRSPWSAGSFTTSNSSLSSSSSRLTQLQSCFPIRLQLIRITSSNTLSLPVRIAFRIAWLWLGWVGRISRTESMDGEPDLERERRSRGCKRSWAGGRSSSPSNWCCCCGVAGWPSTSSSCRFVFGKRHLLQWTWGMTSVRGSELTETLTTCVRSRPTSATGKKCSTGFAPPANLEANAWPGIVTR